MEKPKERTLFHKKILRSARIKKQQLFVIKGMGMLKVSGESRITIHVHKNVKIYGSEVEI